MNTLWLSIAPNEAVRLFYISHTLPASLPLLFRSSVTSDSVTPRTVPHQAPLSMHGISQASTLERIAISFSRGIFLTQGLNLHFPHWKHGVLTTGQLGKSGDCLTKMEEVLPIYLDMFFYDTFIALISYEYKVFFLLSLPISFKL